MKKFYAALMLLFVLMYGCTTKQKQSIRFKPINETEFNYAADSSFAIPHGKVWDERKKIHDSCMGSSYAVNAVLMRTRDTFMLGCIVDMKTMKVVRKLDLLNPPGGPFSSVFSFTTRPCYEKRQIDIGMDSFMNNLFVLKVNSFDTRLNNELLKAMKESVFTEFEGGSWINMELTDVLAKVLDTTTNTELLEYKKSLLTPGNMILVRSSSISDISFYFHTKQPMSSKLLARLRELTVYRQMHRLYLQWQQLMMDCNSHRIASIYTRNGWRLRNRQSYTCIQPAIMVLA